VTRILTNPLDLAALAAGGVLLLVLLVRLAAVARRASRAQAVTVGLLIPAAMALSMSASTSYRFAGERLGITDLAERMTLCTTAEAAIIALTLHAWGTKSKASAWLAYALVAVQAVPAFSVSGGAGGIVRIVLGPILLALMLHKLLGLEMKFSGEISTGLFASAGREIRERVTARLGIGRRGTDSAAIARSRAADRAVKVASRRRLGRFAEARLSKAIDAAQHGLGEVEAAAAEAAVVTRIVRRRSVLDLYGIKDRHVWSRSTVSAGEEIAELDTAPDIQAPVEPVVWVRNRSIVSGPQGPQLPSRAMRRARTAQATRMAAQQPEQPLAAGQEPDATSVRQVPAQDARRRLDTRPVVAAMRVAYPDMGPDAIAEKLGVTERTVRRHLTAKDAPLEHAGSAA
jgi:hypothetical protein